MKLSISIAMATYNGAKHIGDQLRDLAAQTLLPAELVVCDDGSTDDTSDIIGSFAASAPFPVTLHRNMDRLGYRANFMKAAALCSSDLIGFCDQDDRWNERKLELVAAAFADSQVLLVYHNARAVTDDGRPLGLLYHRHARRIAPLSGNPWFFPLGLTQVFRRSLANFDDLWLQSEDPHSPDEPLAHDQWYFMLASGLGAIEYVPASLADYRRHTSNTSGMSWNWLRLRRLTEFVRARRERHQRASAAANRAEVFRCAAERLSGSPRQRACEAARWYDHAARSLGIG